MAYWQRRNLLFGRAVNFLLVSLILPFLITQILSPQLATSAEPNFKVQIENSLSSSGNKISLFNVNTKSEQTFTSNSSDAISEYLSDGQYLAVLFPNKDESDSRTSSNYRFSISGGVISSFVRVSNYLNEKPSEENVAQNGSGNYRLNLGSTGFKLDLSIGGETRTVSIASILAANKYSKPINPTYLSDGKVVVDIDVGTYTVYGSDANGSDSGYTTCVVTSNSISTCSISLAAPNFLYRILNSNGESFTATSETHINVQKLDAKGGIENSWAVSTSDVGGVVLQDGTYELQIYRSSMDKKTGQSSNYRITVASGAVTEVKSNDSNETFTATSGRYQIKLRSENLKYKVTAGGNVITNFYMYAYNEKSGRNSWAYPDGAGNVSTNLNEGVNRVYFYPSLSGTEFVNVSAKITVVNGVISEFLLNTGEILTKSADSYSVPLLTANVQGTLTIGGAANSGWISGIFDLNLKKWVDVFAVGITSEGKYGLNLPKGSYRIVIQPNYENQGSNFLYANCEVPSSGTVNCNLSAPAKNFTFEVYNVSDTAVVSNANSSITTISQDFSQGTSLWNRNSGKYSLALQDGKHEVSVSSNDPNTDGQSRKYSVYVANGVITRVLNEKTEANISPISGIYRLALGTPNFKAILKANGAPNPRANTYSYQEKMNEYLYSNADSDGRVGFDLPNGRNIIVINTTGNETPTVVSSRFTVIVESSTVTSVSDLSGDTLTATSGVYSLDYQIPNIVGTLTVNNQPVRGYIQGVWNTVLNKSTSYGGTSVDQNGNYAILVAAGNYDIMFIPERGVGGVVNCNATAGIRSTCNLNFPENNFDLKIKNSAGTVLTSRVNATVIRQFSQGQSFPGQRYGFGLTLGASGQFTTSLVDGSYQLDIQSNSPFTDGDSRSFSFKVESGTVSNLKDLETLAEIDSITAKSGIPLVMPNFKAVINANSSAAIGTSGNLYSVSDKGNYYKNFRVDNEGKISFKIPDGQYKMYLYPTGNENPLVIRTLLDIVVSGGEITSVKYRDGSSASSSSGTYTINLGTPNLTGTYMYGGQNASGSDIYFSSIYDENNGRFVDFDFVSNNLGSYGMRIDEGTYLLSLYKYGKSGTLHRCTVSGSTNTCNFDVPLDNFAFRVQSSSGTDLLEEVGANSRIFLDASNKYSGWGFWNRPSNGGIFRTGLKLPTGLGASYEFTVYTTDGSNRRGIARTYRVSVNGESVTAVTDVLTGTAVTPGSDGVYSFRLTAPNLAGTVVAPDGSTPIPNSNVQASGAEIGLGLNTDNSGAFAGYLERDGSYSVWAMAPEFDITKADSARTTVDIVNGSGNSSLNLQLRTPNVSGVVSGPSGVSAYNYIEVLKKNEYGNFEYFGYNVRPRSSNTQGKFAFHLEPGNYKFQAQADEENAGGGRTISAECVVVDTSTAKECNITLLSSNVKLKILGEGNRIYNQGTVSLGYQGSKFDASWPEKTWDNSGINQLGLARLSVGNGTWRGRVEIYGNGNESPLDFTVVIETGTVKNIFTSDGETFTANVDGFYELKLPISNLRGRILDNGSKFIGGSSVSIWSNDAEEGYYTSRWSHNGEFAFSVKPGNYSIEVYPYLWSKETLNSPVRTRLLNCEVPTSGIATCDVTLKMPNFKGKITTPAGKTSEDSYAHIQKLKNDEDGNKYYSWYEGTRVQAGLFSSFLETGTYQIYVYPGWDSGGSYSSNRFEVVVSGGSVQSVKNLFSNGSVSPSSGVYALSLVSPSISGKVLKSGASTTVVKWAQISVLDTVTGDEIWEYTTNSNSSGKFAMTVPDGTYDVVARIWGGKGDGEKGFTSSPKYRVTVVGGVSDSLTIRMRDPNFKLRVVSPNDATLGLANVWIHGNFNGQYFGGVTDENGYFRAYIDTATTTSCTGTCRITLYPSTQVEFVPKSVTFSTVSDIGNVTPGTVNSTVYVYIPTNGGTGVPNKWSWISVEELDASGNTLEENGYGTNELGRVGIGLTVGSKYRITAHPSGEFYGRYSPKSVTINSFSASANAQISITFDSPNITFLVRDGSDNANSWGWYEVFTVDTPTVTKYVDGYLNDQGRGAQYLPDGNYKVIFYPGGSKGVEKTITFTVLTSHATSGSGVTFTNDVGTVILGSGNVTGTVRNNAGAALASVPVTATSTSGAASKVVTVTKSDGTYELNLNISQSWTIQAVDPITLKTGSTTVVENSGSYTDKNISLAP